MVWMMLVVPISDTVVAPELLLVVVMAMEIVRVKIGALRIVVFKMVVVIVMMIVVVCSGGGGGGSFSGGGGFFCNC